VVKDLSVEVAGRGVVSHTGSVALRALADRTGLTAGLSSALARDGVAPVHDRDRVLADHRRDDRRRRAGAGCATRGGAGGSAWQAQRIDMDDVRAEMAEEERAG
jgi:hypothetical protein